MAVDVCSEILSLGSSPRISFSYDLNQTENAQIEQYHDRSDASLLDPNFDFGFDFNFCTGKSFTQEISSADELFSNGKILPTEIKNQAPTRKEIQGFEAVRPNSSTLTNVNVNANANEDTKKKRLKEFLCSNVDSDEEKPFLKIFRQFRRSASLNCESGRTKSLMQFLSRSHSTGSAPSPKQTVFSKDNQKQNSSKQSMVSLSRSSSSSSAYYPYNSSKRPPLKKNNTRGYGSGFRISPVLHISHNCIALGSVSLFGFGSLFCNGKPKHKKNKKKK